MKKVETIYYQNNTYQNRKSITQMFQKDTRRSDKFNKSKQHFKKDKIYKPDKFNRKFDGDDKDVVFEGYTDFLNSKEMIGDIDIKDHMKRMKSFTHELKYPDKFCPDAEFIRDNGKTGPNKNHNTEKNTEFLFEKDTTINIAYKFQTKYPNKNVCILNFASAKNPGGGFLRGSMAQEESIAYVSTLYHALNGNKMYTINRNNPENGLYNHIGIYTNEICVFKLDRDDEKHIEPFYPSIISCSAVNKKHAIKSGISEDTVYDTMISRITLIFEIAQLHNADILILGAFGCGVFGNDPKEVKEIFMGLATNDFENVFEKIVFAIPDHEKYEIFVKDS